MIDLIRDRTGAVITVSHGRALPEGMDTIVELTGLGATRYGGNFSAYRQQKQIGHDTARHDPAHAEKTRAETAWHAQQAAKRKARKDGAGTGRGRGATSPRCCWTRPGRGPRPRAGPGCGCARPDTARRRRR